MSSKVFYCPCGARTTDPYFIGDTVMCVLCAEEMDPKLVERKTRSEERMYRESARNDHQMRRWN